MSANQPEKKRLRWKKHAPETGLRAVGAGPYRSSDLHDGFNVYATVYPSGGDWRGPLLGWYWVSNADLVGEYVNTCTELLQDEAKAKANAKAFVVSMLAARQEQPK